MPKAITTQTVKTTPANTSNLASRPPFPLDESEVIAAVSQKLTDAITLDYQLKMRRPSDDALIAREAEAATILETSADGEERYKAQTLKADAEFFDQIATAAQGYLKPRSEWHPLDDHLRALIPPEHKAVAVSQWTNIGDVPGHAFELEIDPEEFTFNNNLWIVKQTIGAAEKPDFIIRYGVNAPTEGERRELRDQSQDISFKRGEKQKGGRSTIRLRLRPYVNLYDRRCAWIKGATPEDPRLVDPIWKRQVIATVMTAYEVRLSDSK